MKSINSILLALSVGVAVFANGNPDKSCSFIPGLEKMNGLECGHVVVPEDHAKPKGRSIRIAYAVVKTKAKKPAADPMIFFSGGPGGGSLDAGFIEFMQSSLIAETRDIIVFDQRGINHSSSLPDIGKGIFAAMAADTDLEGERKLIAKTLAEFKKTAAENGIELGNYNTNQNARDVGSLMNHLGYKKYNLFGISYGTRLARTIQDLFPEKLNTVILDSPTLMSDDFLIDRMRSYSAAADKVLKFCESDEQCKMKYPDLAAEYNNVVRAIEKKPIAVELDDSTFYINAQDAVYFLRRQLYSNDAKSRFPEFILALKRGDKKIVGEAVRNELRDVTGGSFNTSMFLAVSAFESMNRANNLSVIKQHYKDLPHFPAELGFFTNLYIEGMNWHGKFLPTDQRVFNASNVPTIIFVNQYDPVTPPENGALFQKKLGRSFLYILDLEGHAGGDIKCKLKVMREFMDGPAAKPDSSCLKLFDQE